MGICGTGIGQYVYFTQQFSITVGNNASSGTATLPLPVNTLTSFIVPGGLQGSGAAADINFILTLTNTTTVTATRGTTPVSSSVTITGTVVYASSLLVKTVQSGTISLSTIQTTNTATISAVGTAVAYNSGFNTAGAVTGTSGSANAVLTNSTTVTVTRGASGIAASVGYQVVEFQSGVVKSLQQLTPTITGTNAVDTSTLSPVVNTANSVIIYSGQSQSVTQISSYPTVELTNSNTVTWTRNATASATRNPVATVIEFIPGVIASVNRGVITIGSASTSNTATIGSSSLTRSWCQWLGNQGASGTSAGLKCAVSLTNATTVTGDRNTTGSAGNVSYDVPALN